MAYKSSYSTIYKQLRACIKRTGVAVGETAGYPRVELHSFSEQSPLDKGDAVRVISCVMESISAASTQEAMTLNEGNLERLAAWTYTDTNFKVIGVIPTTFQDLTETIDTKAIIYRTLQSLDIYIQQL